MTPQTTAQARADTQATVYIVDDDEAIRDSLELLFETVGQPARSYPDGNAFLDAWTPDMRGVLVVDIRMPGISGLELQEALNARGSHLPVIFITGHGDIPMAVQAMREGALDFIRKPFRDQELLDRVQEAMQREEQVAASRGAADEARQRIASLTPRETEVFQRVTDGQANKVIAIELGISERTVEIHRAQVMSKTGARNLAQLVRLRIRADEGNG